MTLSGSYKLLVTADDCVSAFSDVLPFSITGDLHTPQSLIVYPVPAIDFLEIQGLTEDIQSANVLTMTGHTIAVQLESSGPTHRISTEMLSTGMYILNIHGQDQVHRIKFSVK